MMFQRIEGLDLGRGNWTGIGEFLCPGDCFIQKVKPFSYEENQLRIKKAAWWIWLTGKKGSGW